MQLLLAVLILSLGAVVLSFRAKTRHRFAKQQLYLASKENELDEVQKSWGEREALGIGAPGKDEGDKMTSNEDSISQRTDGFRLYEGFGEIKRSYDDMVAGVQNEGLGVNICVGPSSIPNAGYGLFVCLNDGVESSEMKQGTPLIGYSRGKFTSNFDGDKTVGYRFSSVDQAIVFEKELMTIFDAIGIISNRDTDCEDLTHIIEGHILQYDHETKDLVVEADDDYPDRYFVPDDAPTDENNEDYKGMDVMNMGMYANDLAYHPKIELETYYDTSLTKNILHLAWRMESKGGKLCPTWPVIILSQPTKFENTKDNMVELGLEYNYRYWTAYEKNREMDIAEGRIKE